MQAIQIYGSIFGAILALIGIAQDIFPIFAGTVYCLIFLAVFVFTIGESISGAHNGAA